MGGCALKWVMFLAMLLVSLLIFPSTDAFGMVSTHVGKRTVQVLPLILCTKYLISSIV